MKILLIVAMWCFVLSCGHNSENIAENDLGVDSIVAQLQRDMVVSDSITEIEARAYQKRFDSLGGVVQISMDVSGCRFIGHYLTNKKVNKSDLGFMAQYVAYKERKDKPSNCTFPRTINSAYIYENKKDYSIKAWVAHCVISGMDDPYVEVK